MFCDPNVQSSFLVPDLLGALVRGILLLTRSHYPHAVGSSRTLPGPCSYSRKTAGLFRNAGGELAYPFRATRYDASPLLYPYSRGQLHLFFPGERHTGECSRYRF
jgi:hypothetical protein